MDAHSLSEDVDHGPEDEVLAGVPRACCCVGVCELIWGFVRHKPRNFGLAVRARAARSAESAISLGGRVRRGPPGRQRQLRNGPSGSGCATDAGSAASGIVMANRRTTPPMSTAERLAEYQCARCGAGVDGSRSGTADVRPRPRRLRPAPDRCSTAPRPALPESASMPKST